MSDADKKLLCGHNATPPKTPAFSPKSNPSSKSRTKRSSSCSYKIEFDSRKQWAQCSDNINIVRDQAQCGGCWAVASSSSFTDRYCIERAKKGQNTPATDPDNQSSDLEVLTCTSPDSGLVSILFREYICRGQ